jgi:hypothetical protein
MSADNWAVCPRCFARALEVAAEQRATVEESYGSIPRDRFLLAVADLKEPNTADFHTFREDYEFWGAESGTIEWRYRGVCTACSLAAELSGSHELFDAKIAS